MKWGDKMWLIFILIGIVIGILFSYLVLSPDFGDQEGYWGGEEGDSCPYMKQGCVNWNSPCSCCPIAKDAEMG